MPKGQLATTVFELVDDSGLVRKAHVKDISYEPTTYRIQHLDFVELHDDVPVSINVPIQPVGMVDCVGMKLGGVCRQVIRSLRVVCLPKDVPSAFEVDIRHLNLKQSMRLKDIKLPESVRAMGNMNEVMIVIAKR